jgi:hypothetical protein
VVPRLGVGVALGFGVGVGVGFGVGVGVDLGVLFCSAGVSFPHLALSRINRTQVAVLDTPDP